MSPESAQPEVMDKIEAKDVRMTEWKNALETRLQYLISEAATLRQTMSAAKTQPKKQYFGKKFKKVNAEVMQIVDMLSKMEYINNLKTQATEEIDSNENTQVPASV
jgi:hypothetical protein